MLSSIIVCYAPAYITETKTKKFANTQSTKYLNCVCEFDNPNTNMTKEKKKIEINPLEVCNHLTNSRRTNIYLHACEIWQYYYRKNLDKIGLKIYVYGTGTIHTKRMYFCVDIAM